MRLGIITDRIEPFSQGGYERRFHELALRMSERGHTVHVFTSLDATKSMKGGKLVYHNVSPLFDFFRGGNRQLSLDFIWSLGLTRILNHELDVIDCNFTPYIHTPFVRLLSTLKKTKLAFTVHEALTADSWYQYFAIHQSKFKWPSVMSNLAYGFTKFALKLPELIIAVSQITGNSLLHNFSAKKVVVIPNGIDLTAFQEKDVNGSQSERRLIYVGRLVPEKGVDRVLLAIKKLKDKGFRVNLDVIGTGPDLQRLQNLSSKLGVFEQTNFLGRVSDEEKITRLRFSHIFIMPSFHEGFSIAVLEAMAAGIPVITAVPPQPEARGTLELVRSGFNGLTYDANSPEQLADCIKLLISDRDLYRRLAKGSIQTAKKYDWSRILPLYEKQMLSLLLGE